MARADTIDAETLRELRDSGLAAVKYGVESGSQRVLDLSGKKLDLQVVEKTVAITKKLGIKVYLTFSIGLLGENRQSLEQTRSLIRRLDPDSYQLSFCTPFPGTDYYDYAKAKGFLRTEDFNSYDGDCGCILRTEELDQKDIEGAYSFIRNEVERDRRSLPREVRIAISDPARVIKYLNKRLRASICKLLSTFLATMRAGS